MGILKPFLPEDVRGKLQKEILRIFESRGGKVLKKDIWGKRHLAYKLRGHEEGYYILYTIDSLSNGIEEIHKELGMLNDLLRYMIVKEV